MSGGSGGQFTPADHPGASASAAGFENPSSLPSSSVGNGSGSFLPSFQYFPLYALDGNDGVVLFPNQFQAATNHTTVDLYAQVKNTTVSTFSWDTSRLTHATGITGASTYRLQFSWNPSNGTAAVNYATLTITNSSSQQESQTYYFQVPTTNVVTLPGSASWPDPLSPDTVRPKTPPSPAKTCRSTPTPGALTPR